MITAPLPEPRLPYLSGFVILTDPAEVLEVSFLVDTGAMQTTLHPADSLRSQIWAHPEHLRIPPVPMVGIGGIASGYERPGVVAFLHTDQRATSFRVWLSVPSPSETNRTFPSLLGTDILRFGRLIVDPAASTVSFDASVGDFDITAG